MKDQNCAYCMQGELVAKFGYPVCPMDSGYLYIFKEQSKPGRVILAYKDHVSEMIDISDEERNQFFADVAKVSRAVHKIFHPDKVITALTGIRDAIFICISCPSTTAETSGAACSR